MIMAAWWLAWYAVPFIVLILVLRVYLLSRTTQLIKKLVAPEYQEKLLHNFSRLRLVLRTVCMVGALFFIWLALLRPQYDDGKPTMQLQQGRDVVVAIDISRSMLAADDPPSRLQSAKQKIEELFKRLPTERVALIVFSGSALVQCPLTKDFDTFRLFLNALDVGVLSSGGTTALDSALTAALDLFKQAPEQRNRLLVVFTDGEDFSQNLSAVQQEAQAMQVHVATVGVGTLAGAPIPEYNETGAMVGHVHDVDGSIAISRLDEERLKRLAKDLHGLYVRLDTKSSKDIDTLVAWVQGFAKEEHGMAQTGLHGETFMYWAAVALVLLMIAWVL